MTPGWHFTLQGKPCERPPTPGKGSLHVRGTRQFGLLPCRASYVEGRLRLAESRERQRVKGASTRGQPAAVGAAAPIGKAAPVTAQASEEERAAAEKAANANMAKLLEEEDALKVCCQGLKSCLCPIEKCYWLDIPFLVEPRWRVTVRLHLPHVKGSGGQHRLPAAGCCHAQSAYGSSVKCCWT